MMLLVRLFAAQGVRDGRSLRNEISGMVQTTVDNLRPCNHSRCSGKRRQCQASWKVFTEQLSLCRSVRIGLG